MPTARRSGRTLSDGATFVLVHGAFHGGWCWTRVAEPLCAAGHRVFTPTQTGLGERAHLLRPDVGVETFVRDVVAVLEAEELTDVILVGHSFGGVAISGAADRVPGRIRHLVYLDALLAPDGRSAFDDLPADVVERRIAESIEVGGVACMKPFPPSAFGVGDPADTAWLERRLTPHPLRTYQDKVRLHSDIGNGLPRLYAVCSDPQYAPLAASRDYVRQAPGWDVRDLPTCHDAMIAAPGLVADLLSEVARRAA